MPAVVSGAYRTASPGAWGAFGVSSVAVPLGRGGQPEECGPGRRATVPSGPVALPTLPA